jgi:hypothetical protein
MIRECLQNLRATNGPELYEAEPMRTITSVFLDHTLGESDRNRETFRDTHTHTHGHDLVSLKFVIVNNLELKIVRFEEYISPFPCIRSVPFTKTN